MKLNKRSRYYYLDKEIYLSNNYHLDIDGDNPIDIIFNDAKRHQERKSYGNNQGREPIRERV